MLSNLEYFAVWCAYIVASLGFSAVLWRVTRSFNSPEIRNLTRGLVAALLLTPLQVLESEYYLAPAIFVALFDGTLYKGVEAYRAFLPLIVSITLVSVVVSVESLLCRRSSRKLAKTPA